MDIKIAAQWALLLFFSGLGTLLLTAGVALVWRMFRGKEFPSFEHFSRMWSEYNEEHGELAKLKKENAKLKQELADLKRELEEMKRKE